jgi:hypothetical protein
LIAQAAINFLFKNIRSRLLLPHPALSKGEGFKKSEVKVLSFGEDLGEAKNKALNFLTTVHFLSLYYCSNLYQQKQINEQQN